MACNRKCWSLLQVHLSSYQWLACWFLHYCCSFGLAQSTMLNDKVCVPLCVCLLHALKSTYTYITPCGWSSTMGHSLKVDVRLYPCTYQFLCWCKALLHGSWSHGTIITRLWRRCSRNAMCWWSKYKEIWYSILYDNWSTNIDLHHSVSFAEHTVGKCLGNNLLWYDMMISGYSLHQWS